MTKLFRKFIIMILALTVAFTAVGCEGCNQNSDSGNTGPNTSVVVPETPIINMPSASSLIVGDTYTLRPQLKNVDGELTWKSSNSSIAVVEDGVVTGVNEGTAQITAEYGAAVATCTVSVSFGDFIPSIQTVSGLENDPATFTINKTYPINPYVVFNSKQFYDATFEYVVEDDSVLEVNENNEIVTKNKVAQTSVTINASWRKFNSNEYQSLSTSFDIKVSNNVLFFENDAAIKSFDIQTPASFMQASEYNNVYTLNPTVSVDGSAPAVITSENITITPIEGTQEGVDYTIVGNKITANRLGKLLITYKYTDETSGTVYTDSFNLGFARPVKTLTDKVKYFSTLSGFAKDDELENLALEQFAWGADVELYDAYENGTKLTISSNGAVTGATSGTDSVVDTIITLGTRTEIYEIPVTAATMFISTKEDVVTAFELEQRHVITRGYFELLRDVDMEEHLMLNTGFTFDRSIGFGGVFDGMGYTISNVRVSLQNATPWDPAINDYSTTKSRQQRKGFFSEIIDGAIIRNVGFVNMIPDKGNGDCGMTGPISRSITNGSEIRNCYFQLADDNSLGVIPDISDQPTIVNVVIEQIMPDGYVFDAERYEKEATANSYGIGILGYSISKLNRYDNYYSTAKDIVLISKKPLCYIHETNGTPNTDDLTTDYFLYGDNETEYYYDYSMLDGVDFADAKTYVASNRYYDWDALVYKTAPAGSKVVAKKGLYRYNTFSDMANDNSEMKNKTLATFSPLYWDTSSGAPIWKGYNATRYEVVTSTKEVALYNETEISVQLLGEKVDATFTSDSDLVSINNEKGTISGVSTGKQVKVTATWTDLDGQVQTKDIYLNVVNPKYRGTKLQVNGENYNSFSVELEINTEKEIGILHSNKPTSINSVVSANTDVLEVNGNKVFGKNYGESLLTIDFTDFNGETHTVKYLAVVTKVNVFIDDEIVYDASEGKLVSTSLPEEILKATVKVTSKIGSTLPNAVLTFENGGLYMENGTYKIRNKISLDDNLAGVPMAGNNDKYVEQAMTFSLETEDRLYVYTNVVYYSNIIESAKDFQAFVEYPYAANNVTDYGYYKLAVDLDLAGVMYPNRATAFHTYSIAQNTKYAFAGMFDGEGHVISNFNQGEYGMFGTVKEPADIKNFALVNLGEGPILGSVMVDGPAYTSNVSNVYVSYAQGVKPQGLFNHKSYGGEFGYANSLKVTNVVIDSSNYNDYIKLAKDNAAYGFTGEGYDHVIEYPTADTRMNNTFALLNSIRPNGSTSVLNTSGTGIENAFENVIIIGKAPAISSFEGGINSALYTHTLAEDGSYVHAYRNTSLSSYAVNFTGWAAGNLTTADIPTPTTLKAGFAELAKSNDGSALPGYICKKCFETFATEEGTCACGEALTYSADLWTEIGSYNWTLYDLTTHTSKLVKDGNYKLSGVSKYVDVASMPTDPEAYKAFTDTGLWKVVDGKLIWNAIFDVNFDCPRNVELSTVDANNASIDFNPQVTVDGQIVTPTITSSSNCIEIANGKITAKSVGSAVVTLKVTVNGVELSNSFIVNVSNSIIVEGVVDFEASSGLLKTTACQGDISKVTVTAYDVTGNAIVKELTVANGGILANGSLKVLTSYDDTYGDIAGVPYANNLVSVTKLDNKGIKQQMKFVVETSVATYSFNNVMYYSDIIENTDEFVALANWDYATTYINANYYKLATDINAEGLAYDKRANNVSKVFAYPSAASSAYAGFRGRFDGDGHKISNFNPSVSATNDYGLFGALMAYDDHTQTFRLATQIVIKNVAFENIYSGPVLGRYAPTSRAKCFFDANEPLTLLENIYVSVKEGETLRGLIGGKGSYRDQHNLNSMSIDMKNIVIDATKANVKLAKDNKAYLVEGADGTIVNQFANTNVVDFQDSYAIFGAWIQDAYHSAFNDVIVNRFVNEALENVVILGNIPVALRRSNLGEGTKSTSVAHIDNGDGTFTHTAKAKLERNDVYAYACNQTVGDIPVITGLKPAFLAAAGVSTNDGSTLGATYDYVCYVCGTPYKGWTLTCPNAECALNQNLNGGWSGNPWSSPAIYTYTVRDLTKFENNIPNFTGLMTGSIEFVLQGVYKYNDGVIKANEVNLDAFTSTGLWKVVDGKLTWNGNVA